MMDSVHIVIFAGLVIGLIYGAVGLVSGFCLMSSLRGWWADGDGRLVRTYALAMGIGIAASQLLAAYDLVDPGKSIYLQPTFSAPLMFFGGLLFGYGMVMSNGCGSRALVLLGRGNLRSFVVIIVLGIVAEMTLKGLIAPSRVALLQASQTTATVTSLPALVSSAGLHGAAALAVKNGIEPHAGHGLTYDNVGPIAAIPQVRELNIGHFLIGEAIFLGLAESIARMRAAMDAAR